MAGADEEDAAPQGVGDGEFPVVLVEYSITGKIIDGVDAYTSKKGLFKGGGFQEKMGEAQVDDDDADVAYVKGGVLNAFGHVSGINSTGQ